MQFAKNHKLLVIQRSESTTAHMELHVFLHLGQEAKIMASIQEVKDAIAQVATDIAAEKAEVQAKIGEMAARIQALIDQIAAGTAATPTDLDALIAALTGIDASVKDISEPAVPA